MKQGYPQFTDKIMRDLKTFSGDQGWNDDVTIVAVNRSFENNTFSSARG